MVGYISERYIGYFVDNGPNQRYVQPVVKDKIIYAINNDCSQGANK